MGVTATTTSVAASRRLGPDVFELAFKRPAGFDFSAGQRLRIHLGEASRDYSIASPPGADRLTICLRRFAGGRVSPHLSTLRAGAPVTVSGPYGHFRFQASGPPAVFVATGTGIAPFRAMVLDGRRPHLVIHGVPVAAARFYREDFQAAAVAYTACLSRENGAPHGDGCFTGRVTRYLQQRLPPGAYDFYLCGRQEMIRDATLILDERFGGGRVYTEAFY